MLPQEYRFRAGRISSEVLGLLCLGGFLEGFLWATRGYGRYRLEPFLAGLALLAAVLLACLWFRWRSRLRLTTEGAEWRRSADRVVTRIPWSEVDEIFLLGFAEFEIRGAGKRIRFSGVYDRVDRAREHCSAALPGLRERLHDRALQQGELLFRTPGSRWAGHAAYLATVLLLTAVTGLVILAIRKTLRSGIPFFIVLFGAGWLWRLRSRASRRGTRVTLYKDGLLVRRLDGSDRLAWSDLIRTEWTDRGELRIHRRKGEPILLPSTLGNLPILEEFLESERELGTPSGTA